MGRKVMQQRSRTRSVSFLLGACICQALAASSLSAAVDMEWNVHRETAVPYEVELSPSRLGWGNLSLMADGRRLPFQAFEGREKGFVGIRFSVPEGTRRLSCEKAPGAPALVDSSEIDNLFAGALAPGQAGKWKSEGGSVKVSNDGGALRLECTRGRPLVTYEVPVPRSLRGRPARLELDVESRTRMTWGGIICFRQFDENGRELPQCVSDPRWTSHMRPCGVKAPYREEGRFDPRVSAVRLEIEMRAIMRDVDEYGMPNRDKSTMLPVLIVSRLALRGAASLPFPRFDDANFTRGVSGEPGDEAICVGGERAFWYQCNPRAVWAEGKALRDEAELFFPLKDGTAEAWFKPSAWKEPGRKYVLFDAFNGYRALTRGEGVGSMFSLAYRPGGKELELSLVDSDRRKFAAKGKADIPAGAWTHVAMQWVPGDRAEVFVGGKKVVEV